MKTYDPFIVIFGGLFSFVAAYYLIFWAFTF